VPYERKLVLRAIRSEDITLSEKPVIYSGYMYGCQTLEGDEYLIKIVDPSQPAISDKWQIDGPGKSFQPTDKTTSLSWKARHGKHARVRITTYEFVPE
jgi:hypothetical protein